MLNLVAAPTVGEKWLVETTPLHDDDVIFGPGLQRYVGMRVRWITPEDGALYETTVSANSPLPAFGRCEHLPNVKRLS
jgi:hypothetical protein